MNDRQAEVRKNFRTFKEKIPVLSRDFGKYALLRHGDLVATYDTFEDALKTATSFYADGFYSIQLITDKPVDLGLRSRALHSRKI